MAALALPAALFWLAPGHDGAEALASEAGALCELALLWALLPWREGLASRLPAWSADRPVIAFCQTTVLVLSLGGTLVLPRRRLLTPRWSGLALSALALGLASVGRWLVAPLS